MGEQKPKMADSIRKIRAVFLREWDPIGVSDSEHGPDNEYDAYVGPVYSILRQRKGEDALSAYLAEVYERITGERLLPEEFRSLAERFLQIDVSEDEIHC